MARSKGFTLLELLVTIAIAGILLSLGVPAMGNWIKSAGVNSAAESLQNGLRQAQQEAVRRNATVDFMLVNVNPGAATSSTAAVSGTTGWTSWIIRLSSDNSVLEGDNVSQSASNATLSSSSSGINTLHFSGFGQVTNSSGAALSSPAVFLVTNSDIAKRRCIYVTPGGAVKVCDPSAASTNPTSCASALSTTECPAP